MRRYMFLMITLAALTVAAGAAEEKGVKKANYNIMEYGAIGDGEKDDAPAIQKAIDICAKAGGGRVLIPAGRTFLSSPLGEN